MQNYNNRKTLYCSYHGTKDNIAMFLVTILQHKTLASYVKRASLYGLHATSIPTSYLKTDHFKLFITHVKRLHISGHVRSKWIKFLRRGHGEALACLLVSYLPQLQKLEIRVQDQHTPRKKVSSNVLILGKPIWTFVFGLPAKKASRLPKFDSLRTLTMRSLPFSIQDLVVIFATPTIKSCMSRTFLSPA